jgi:hypothetical protein
MLLLKEHMFYKYLIIDYLRLEMHWSLLMSNTVIIYFILKVICIKEHVKTLIEEAD